MTDTPSPIPTGRYSITLPGPTPLPIFVKLTRVTTPRRWTTIAIAGHDHPDTWTETPDPATRSVLLAALRRTDLPTASALYTAHTGICGVCGHPCASDHDRCLARKFGDDSALDSANQSSTLDK